MRELKSTVDRLVLLFDGMILREPWWEAPEARAPDQTYAPPPTVEAHEALLEPVPATGVTTNSSAGFGSGTVIPNTKQKLALAQRLLAESDNNYSWVAGQLGINSSTLWRWRKAGKLG